MQTKLFSIIGRVLTGLTTYFSKRLFIAALCLLPLLLNAQIRNPHFVRVTTGTGLPSDNIHEIIQDQEGYIWISTNNGLARYDGSEITTLVYKAEENKNPVVDFTSLMQDNSGQFWFGSYNGLLLNYTRYDRTFHQSEKIDFVPKSHPVSTIYQDSEGNIWFGNESAILWKITTQTGDTSLIKLPSENENTEITDLREDFQGNIWIATNQGVYKYDKQSGLFSTYKHKPNSKNSLISNHVLCLQFDSKNNLWIGTDSGMDYFSPEELSFTHYQSKADAEHRLSGDRVNCILIDSRNQLWVGTNKGLNLKREDGKGFQFFQYKEYQDNSIPGNYITTLFEDHAGHLWVGTLSGGAGILDLQPKSINNTRFIDQINELITTEITSVFYDTKTASLWLGTESEGVFHFLLKNNAYPYAYFNHESGQLYSNSIRKIFVDKDGLLWIIYEDNHLEIKAESGNKLRPIKLSNRYPEIGKKTRLQLVYQDEQENLWVASDKKLYCIPASEETETKIYDLNTLFPDVDEQISIKSIVQDYRKNIWLGSSAYGIVVLNPQTGTTKRYVSNPVQTESLSSNRIYCLLEDHMGVMWIGTVDGGLNKFDRINNRFQTIQKSDGLASNSILALLEDDDNKLWIGTSAGLNRLNQASGTIALYDNMNGLKGNSFVENAATLGKNGDLYFATRRGFNAFNPIQQENGTECLFDLVFTDFVVNSQSIFQHRDSTLQQEFLSGENITLQSKQQNIGIKFSALEFLNPNNVNYFYKLDGVDQDWVDGKKNNFVSYINLSPGTYTFNLKATDKAGNFTPYTAKLHFEIATPIYKRSWFVLLLFFFVVVIIVSIIRIRIRNITLKNEQLEELVNLKTKELLNSNKQLQKEIDERIKAEADAERASQSKSQFLANMSHEIRTPMNAIIGFTDLLASLVKDEKQRYYLNSIRSSGRSLLVLINDILDLSKIEAGHFRIDYRAVNLNHLFEEIRQVFALKCDEKDLAFNMEIDKNIPNSLIMSEIRVRQVLVNLIGNALKFTEKGAIGLRATVIADALSENKINLLIEVSDTGIGIGAEEQVRIFQAFHQTEGQDVRKYGGTGLGLSISKRLVELMGGKIKLDSELGKGSTFKVYLNDVEISDQEVVYSEKTELKTIQQLKFKPAKLLVVDDSATNRSLIIELFRDTAIEVLEAGNGQEAVDKTKLLLPDIVLMDIRMPVLNGFDAVKLIREDEHVNGVPVIALTASIADEEENKYELAGFNHVLLKPLDMEELLQVITRILPHEKISAEEKEDKSRLSKTGGYLVKEDKKQRDLPLAVEALKLLLPLQAKLQKQKFVNEIARFAKQVGEIGRKYTIQSIQNYANDLSFHTENFDIEKMEKTLNNFPNFIDALAKMVKG